MHRLLAALAVVVSGAGALAIALPRQDAPGFTEDEVALVRSLSLAELPPVPPDPSNRVADDPRAAELGRAIFFDTRFSSNGEVACATCHLPDRQFQDDRALARGVGQTGRRTMPIAGMPHNPFLFWDGRKDSLWAQALGPLESAVEHGGDRTQYAHTVAANYAEAYSQVFGPFSDLDMLPAHAGPVTDPAAAAAWEGMAPADRDAVNAMFANIGKAIAAFERTITPPETRFDAWVASPDFPGPGLLTAKEIAGLKVFIGEDGCTNCHNGPLLTDTYFHNTGVPAVPGLPEDRGRQEGARQLLEDPFNCLGPYSDAEPEDCKELRFMAPAGEEMLRAFKTPSLRGVASRAPYMHAGQITSLVDVIAHYSAAPDATAGHSELRPLVVDAAQKRVLEAFLASLDPLE
jgi:cytochrome c peroxidase